MKRWLMLCMMLWAAPVAAQDVAVSTGEHDGFTRIVLQSPRLSGWQLSRLPDGYALSLRQPAEFDLSGVFNPIGRHRLAAIAAGTGGKALTMTLGCACHAIGFDYRPGVVVIDLRDGPPPEGSSFELTAQGEQAETLRPVSLPDPPRPKPRPTKAAVGWNWVDAVGVATPELGVAPPLASADATALRAALVGGVAQGVVQGLVDPVQHLPLATAPQPPTPDSARLALVALPGIATGTAFTDPADLTAAGAICPTDDRLDITAWGDPDRPIAAQMGEVAAILGEFDEPDPVAVARAVHLTLWLGFGAEAEGLTTTFAPTAADATLWRGMARALDGTPDPDQTFAGMSGCDGQAAFWAALAQPRLLPPDVNKAAVIRAFSALPPHLRQHLGPDLVDRFLNGGDAATARALRDAMVRGNGEAGAKLVDADLALQSGQPLAADALAQAALADGGPSTTDALVTMIEAHTATAKPVSTADVTAIDAMLEEQSDNPSLQRAAILAHALAGDFDAAFARLDLAPSGAFATTSADLWAILAKTGPKSAVLTHAVLPQGAAPVARPETRAALAQRLIDYGFGKPALLWLGSGADAVALGAAELSAGDTRAALTRLAGLSGETALDLRAKALLQLGDPAGAAQLWAAAGNPDAATDATLRARDWATLRDSGSAPWQAAAKTLAPTPAAKGPLSTGQALLTQSAQTRTAITALLDQTPRPQD